MVSSKAGPRLARDRSPLADAALASGVTLFSLFRSGYRFNGADNSFYLPIFYHTVNPSLFSGDYFLTFHSLSQSAVPHFWLLAPLVRWLGLGSAPYVYLILYVVCLWLIFYILVRLFRAFGGSISPTTIVGLVLLAALADIGVTGGGGAAFDRYLIPRLEAKVAGLAAFYLTATNRPIAAMWLAGLGTLLHPGVGIFMLGAVALYSLLAAPALRTARGAAQLTLPVALCGLLVVTHPLAPAVGSGDAGDWFAAVDLEFFQLREPIYLISTWDGAQYAGLLVRVGLVAGIVLWLRSKASAPAEDQPALRRFVGVSLAYLALGTAVFALAQWTHLRVLLTLNPARVFGLGAYLLAAAWIGVLLAGERRRPAAWMYALWPAALAGLVTAGAFFPYKGWIGVAALLASLLGVVVWGAAWWLAAGRWPAPERRAWAGHLLAFALGVQALLIRDEFLLGPALLAGGWIAYGLLRDWRLWPARWLSGVAASRAGLAMTAVVAVAYPAAFVDLASQRFPNLSLLPEKFLTIQWPGRPSVSSGDVDGQARLALYDWIRENTPADATIAFTGGDLFGEMRETTFRSIYYYFRDGGLADPAFAQVWLYRANVNERLFSLLFDADGRGAECALAAQEAIDYAVFRREAPLGGEAQRFGPYSLVDFASLCADAARLPGARPL